MIGRSVIVSNRSGLHARVASQFCARAKQYQAQVVILVRDQWISARSILDVMAANIRQGECISIYCDGPEEALASDALVKFLTDLRE
jgi:phosphocarrier protein